MYQRRISSHQSKVPTNHTPRTSEKDEKRTREVGGANLLLDVVGKKEKEVSWSERVGQMTLLVGGDKLTCRN